MTESKNTNCTAANVILIVVGGALLLLTVLGLSLEPEAGVIESPYVSLEPTESHT